MRDLVRDVISDCGLSCNRSICE